jgi:LysM repeat protein
MNYFYKDFTGKTNTTKPTVANTGNTYTVKRGDTLSSIAKKYDVSCAVLAAHNGIENPDKIYAGQVLKIPAKKTVTEIAKEVIRGDWGNGSERKRRLITAGYDYSEVQKKVTELLK